MPKRWPTTTSSAPDVRRSATPTPRIGAALTPGRRAPSAEERRDEVAFLALGEGARLYLVEAAAVGARRIETRMAEALSLSALHGTPVVNHTLGVAAMAGRLLRGRPRLDHRPRRRGGGVCGTAT